MSEWNGQEYLPWYRRPTATWLELSAAARGVLVSIAMELNPKTGKVLLRKGLPSLAIILRIPWDVLEPALGELIAAEKLVWDGSHFELFDPEFETRRVPTSRERVARWRAKQAEEAAAPLPAPSPEEDLKQTNKQTNKVTLPTLRNGCNVTDVTSWPPEWWEMTCATVEAGTGASIDRQKAWLRYEGHRVSNGKRMSEADARYWLTTVDVREQQQDRQRERVQRDLAEQRRYPPEPPKISREQSQREAKRFAERMLAAKRKAAGE